MIVKFAKRDGPFWQVFYFYSIKSLVYYLFIPCVSQSLKEKIEKSIFSNVDCSKSHSLNSSFGRLRGIS